MRCEFVWLHVCEDIVDNVTKSILLVYIEGTCTLYVNLITCAINIMRRSRNCVLCVYCWSIDCTTSKRVCGCYLRWCLVGM